MYERISFSDFKDSDLKPCPGDEGHLPWLDHDDILVIDAMTSSLIAKALVGIRNGSMLRSVGSNNMFFHVFFSKQEWHVVCQRVRKVHPFLIRGTWVFDGFGTFMFLFSALCILGVTGLPPVVYNAWVTLVCLLLGSSFGGAPVGTLPL